MVKKILVLLFIVFCSHFSVAQQINAHAFTDSLNYKVGDYIRYTISVDYDKNIKIQNPVIKDSLKNVEIINSENPATSEKNGKVNTKFVYIISYYDSADVVLPPITINFTIDGDKAQKNITANSVKFAVHSLAVDTAKGIKDIAEPVTIPFDWRIVWIIILIIIILLVAAYFIWRYYKKKRLLADSAAKEVILPHYAIALNALKELDAKKLWQDGNVKEYHSEITEIIRIYFSKRFNLPALELTTSEALYNLRNIGAAREIIQITESFLNNADMVKFAKFQPFYSINEEMMKQAIEIVQKTIPLADKKKEGVEKIV
jgi:hypothetical protein